MDQNLYFRFFVPPWAGVLAALGANAVLGGDWTSSLCLPKQSDALIAILTLLFASPTAGYLLGTLVVVVCHWRRWGPEYEPALKRFRARLHRVVKHMEHENAAKLVEALKKASASGAVAHFEYLLDRPELLAWRRRQRAAYYAGWTTALAIFSGACIGAIAGRHEWSSVQWWRVAIMIVSVLLFIAVTSCNAIKSGKNATEQQAFSLYNLTESGMRRILEAQADGRSIDGNDQQRGHRPRRQKTGDRWASRGAARIRPRGR